MQELPEVLGLDLDLEETARQTGALLRRREIRTASQLLRLVLMYVVSDWSLRSIGQWAYHQGLACVSDVALLKRFRRCSTWLGMLIALILRSRGVALRQMLGIRIRIQDASVISRPGAKGTDYRAHVGLNLWPLGIDGIEITDSTGGESLARMEPDPNEIRLIDRGYAHANGLGADLEQGGRLVVRMSPQNLALQDLTEARFNPFAWLKSLTGPSEIVVLLPTPFGCFQLRLLALPLPPEAAERARQRARQNSAKKGRTVSQETLLSAGFVMLLTNLPAENWPMQFIFWMYRLRWQIELVFKRMKGLIQIDQLRAQDPRMVQTYLLAKILVALLLDGLTHQVAYRQPDWFLSLERPVSMWRLTQFLFEQVRQWVMGNVNAERFQQQLGNLRRYFCDSPRDRPQQLATARVFLEALNRDPAFFSW